MTIRALTKNDLPRLIAIENSVQIVPWARDAFLACFEGGCHGSVAVLGDLVVGFVLTTVKVGECHILNVCVDRLYQRQGYARALMQHAEAEAKRLGAEVVHLEVRRSNARAIALYEQLGYRQIGERKDYYPSLTGQEDALLYARLLD